MEHPDFTEQDERRLSRLQRIADGMQDKAFKDSPLKQWGRLLGVPAVGALLCVFFLPGGRGEALNWASYLFLSLSFVTAGLFFCILYWRNQIQRRVEEEFFSRHGVEYNALSARREFAERNIASDE